MELIGVLSNLGPHLSDTILFGRLSISAFRSAIFSFRVTCTVGLM